MSAARCFFSDLADRLTHRLRVLIVCIPDTRDVVGINTKFAGDAMRRCVQNLFIFIVEYESRSVNNVD